MKNSNKAVLAGASGLVGSHLLQALLKADFYQEVCVLTRRALPIQHEKLKQVVLDFMALDEHADLFKSADVYCCIGTTMKAAKRKDLFHIVDVYFPKMMAALSEAEKANRFSVVSSAGANSKSKFFYLRSKGEMEEAVSKYKIPSIHIFRPSLLLGKRKAFRLLEALLALPLFMISSLSVFKSLTPLTAEKLSRFMLSEALSSRQGLRYYESAQIKSAPD